MQMLSVVSGAEMINGIPTYFASLGKNDGQTHRDAEKKVFAARDVEIVDTSSLLFKTTHAETLKKVPFWYHQGVLSIEGTALSLTGVALTDGVRMIEGVERKDLSFCLGVQFHPKVAVRKIVDKEGDADKFVGLEFASSFFKTLASH